MACVSLYPLHLCLGRKTVRKQRYLTNIKGVNFLRQISLARPGAIHRRCVNNYALHDFCCFNHFIWKCELKTFFSM